MSAFPIDDVFQITDETSARAFIMERGLLGKVRGNLILSENAFAVDHDYPTHWLLMLHIIGHPDPVENGHMVIGWPKSQFTRLQVDEQIKGVLRKFGISQVRAELRSSPDAN